MSTQERDVVPPPAAPSVEEIVTKIEQAAKEVGAPTKKEEAAAPKEAPVEEPVKAESESEPKEAPAKEPIKAESESEPKEAPAKEPVKAESEVTKEAPKEVPVTKEEPSETTKELEEKVKDLSVEDTKKEEAPAATTN